MSFRAGHASKQQPKQGRHDEDAFERSIRANVQEMQEAVRKATSQLDQAQRSRLSRRNAEALGHLIKRCEELSEDTSKLFRDWTVHLAGEPAERHRKKFSFEKLQKAFEAEVAQHRDVSRRASMAQAEAESRPPVVARECKPVCEEQDATSACDMMETGLLDDSATLVQEDDATLRIRHSIAREREEGIRRIQGQVSEVNQMFRDLASIVQEQGHQFESIERHAETAAASTKQAVQELRKAVDRQRGSRERMCCMLAVAVMLLCFVILPHLHMLHPRLAVHGRPAGEEPQSIASATRGHAKRLA
mmetsp:Transcript_4504/g.12330  ORF Transcript_4504/g.12330 Transcript_4504/m.12330 type:complete len:304 (-) Transcript_4504:223-1134(-)